MSVMEKTETQTEYITIKITDGIVSAITPESPQTKGAFPQPGEGLGKKSIGDVVAKMAEYDYRLVPGLVVPATTTCNASFIFMERRK